MKWKCGGFHCIVLVVTSFILSIALKIEKDFKKALQGSAYQYTGLVTDYVNLSLFCSPLLIFPRNILL